MGDDLTRASLLIQLRDPSNAEAWSEFVSLYMPLLHGYAMKFGLQDSDAADLAQDTIRQVIRNIDRFDYTRERGSFRGWLLTIARNQIRRNSQKFTNRERGTGDTDHIRMVNAQPSREESDQWEAEYQRVLFSVAAEKIKCEFRSTTWLAFWHTAVEGNVAVRVSEQLNISLAAVYIARSRVLARLREEVARLDD